MASFRNHRVVIASLFLPTTPVLGESPPLTPDQADDDDVLVSSPSETTVHAVAQRLADSSVFSSHSRQSSLNIPIKSIVDDLKDKVCAILTINPNVIPDLPQHHRAGLPLLRSLRHTKSPTLSPNSRGSRSTISIPLLPSLDVIAPHTQIPKHSPVSEGKAVLSLAEPHRSTIPPPFPYSNHGTWNPTPTATVA